MCRFVCLCFCYGFHGFESGLMHSNQSHSVSVICNGLQPMVFRTKRIALCCWLFHASDCCPPYFLRPRCRSPSPVPTPILEELRQRRLLVLRDASATLLDKLPGSNSGGAMSICGFGGLATGSEAGSKYIRLQVQSYGQGTAKNKYVSASRSVPASDPWFLSSY